LFFEFVKCVDTLKPKYFLLENVKMKKEYLDIISEYMGVEPIFINSSLVSAQSRQRYYWTNIPGIEQPEERGIVLRDILEDQVGSEHYVGDNMQKNYKGGNQLNPNYKSQANTIHNSDKKSGTICAGTHGYANGYVGDKHKPVKQTERNARHLKQLDDKSLCMTATMYKGAGNNGMTLVPQKIHDIPKDVLKDNERQRRVYSKEGKSPTLLARSDSPKVMKSDKPQHIGTAVDIKGHDQIKRVYSPDGKSPTVTTCGGGHREPKVVVDVRAMTEVRTPEANKIRQEHRKKTGKDWSPRHMRHLVERKDEKMNTLTTALTKQHILQITKDKDQEVYWRKLTPLECERLQTVPDNYTNHVSNTQRYKMLGNGWTIEVIAHILQNMEIDNV
jgi:site-specific DNA-cytosine methylase